MDKAKLSTTTFTANDVREEAKEASGKVEHVNIDIAENGFMCRVCYAPKKSEKRDGPTDYEEPKTQVFSDVPSLVAYLEEVL